MNVLDQIIEKLNFLQPQLEELVGHSVQKNQVKLIDFVEGQLDSGRDSKGKRVKNLITGGGYSKYTQKVKGVGKFPITLKDTGENFDKMEIVTDFQGGRSYLVANTPYHASLLKSYKGKGQDPFGVSDANLRKFAAISVRPDLEAFMDEFKRPIA
jgi:hypothetical protein